MKEVGNHTLRCEISSTHTDRFSMAAHSRTHRRALEAWVAHHVLQEPDSGLALAAEAARVGGRA